MSNFVQLHTEAIKRGLSERISTMKVLAIGDGDFELFCARFGEFGNFVVMSDEAVEVCKAVGFSVTPPGSVLGPIEASEFRDASPLIGAR